MAEPAPKTQAADSGALLPRNSGEDDQDEGPPGPAAGICEAFLLLWCIPGFGYVSAFAGLVSGGGTLAWIFVFPNLEKLVWDDKAASYTAWMNAGRSLVAVLLCAHFGSWSDKHSRKAAVVVMTISTLIVALPVLVFGSSSLGLWVCVVLVVITGPFAVRISGSPVLWAWASDYLGPEHKEVGFAIIGAASAMGSFVILLIAKAVAALAPGKPEPFLYMNLACLILCLLIVAFAPPGAHMPELTDADLPEEQGLMQAMFGPMRLVAKKPVLRATCVVVALLTLPDIAAQDISSQIIFSFYDTPFGGNEHPGAFVNICYNKVPPPTDVTACIYDEATFTMNAFSVYPRPLTFVVVMLVGIFARRFGPHKLVRVWVPVTAILFAFPVVLKTTTEPQVGLLLLSGFFTLLPLTNYGPLQALITHIVHPAQVGEAMGAIATVQNIVSVLAPLIIGAFTEYLAETHNNDLLWIVYPGCAFVMLCAWPFTFCLEKRVARDSLTWSSWASAARPSTIRSALNARSSAMFSARP